MSAAPAAAHLAIRLDIRAPQPGQHVGHDVDVVVFAQQTLAGVDQTSYSASLDGHPLDPASGRVIAQSQLSVIHVNAEVHIALRGLATGGHELAVSYRPDTDMPIFHTSVRFTVGPRRAPIALFGAAAIALAGLAAVVSFVVLRRRSPRKGMPARRRLSA